MNLLNVVKALLLAVVCTISMAVLAPSNAYAGNFELEIGGGWNFWDRPMSTNFDKRDLHGGMFFVSPAWRFNDYVALTIDQELGFQPLKYKESLCTPEECADPNKDTFWWFIGGTYLNLKAYLALGGPVELFAKVGAGVQYITWDKFSGATANTFAWFAAKFAVGGTYMFNDTVGLGMNIDYTLGYGDNIKHRFFEGKDFHHMVDVQMHLKFGF